MRRPLAILFLTLAASLHAGGSDLSGKELAGYRPVVQERALDIILPPDLRPLQLEDPRVEFRVIVDPRGQILDSLATSATHHDLLEAAEKALAQAKFKPATLDGKPVTGKITVTVTFYDPEQRMWRQGGIAVPMGVSVSDAVERRMYDLSKQSFVYRESNPSELDQPLRLLQSKLSMVHPEGGTVPKGSVLVEYYVDHAGNVRLPEIIESDSEYLSMSVLMTLRDTLFASPTRDGHPTYVKVRQPFNFG